jgi:Type I restriction enzyme R protein N terminus (HSDR_N)
MWASSSKTNAHQGSNQKKILCLTPTMKQLNLPSYNFSLRNESAGQEIFDRSRKKYVRLTPEEWVRQNFIEYLVNEKQYARSLISVEKEIIVNKLKRRPDIVVFKNDMKPILAVECKAPEVKIAQETFDQLIRYNSIIKVKYLVVTNGMQHFCCQIDYLKNAFSYLQEIPGFHSI